MIKAVVLGWIDKQILYFSSVTNMNINWREKQVGYSLYYNNLWLFLDKAIYNWNNSLSKKNKSDDSQKIDNCVFSINCDVYNLICYMEIK